MGFTEVRVRNQMAEIARLVAESERFGREHALPASAIHDLSLVLDEIVGNIIAYGFAPGAESEISIKLGYAQGEISVEIEDEARPFDPLQAPAPDLTSPLETRRIGGLGIHFARSLMDEIVYARVGNKNRLQMKKFLSAGT